MKGRLVILGAGESGTGAAVLGKRQGYDVFLSDGGSIKERYRKILVEEGIEYEEGTHTEEKIFNATEVVKSPGIPDKAPLIKALRKKEIPVVSEIEFASRFTNAKMICITGSNGKTTTTLLTYHILQKAGFKVGLGGNVGKSFAMQVAEGDYDYYVLELSSFQLDGMYQFKADIAILTNITPDHLDRYEYDFSKYIDSKFRIINNQTENDAFIFCIDDPVTKEEVEKRIIKATKYPVSLVREVEQGAYVKDQRIIFINNDNQTDMSIESLALQGKHNAYNSMAAGVAARVLEIRKDVIRESLSDFENIEHRLEYVTKVHGIEFINDSKATNVNSTWYALESMSNPVIWIVGGVDKGNDYEQLRDLVKDKVKAIICLGKENEKIHQAFSDIIETIVDTGSAEEAVKRAYYLGKQGDTVLLSPACASFDLFENYEDRGRQFKTAVRSL